MKQHLLACLPHPPRPPPSPLLAAIPPGLRRPLQRQGPHRLEIDRQHEGLGRENGVIFCDRGGGGWLMTEKEYGDFELRLEYKMPKGGNSGVGMRSRSKGDPAYAGMEIQLIDDVKAGRASCRTGSTPAPSTTSCPPKKINNKRHRRMEQHDHHRQGPADHRSATTARSWSTPTSMITSRSMPRRTRASCARTGTSAFRATTNASSSAIFF